MTATTDDGLLHTPQPVARSLANPAFGKPGSRALRALLRLAGGTVGTIAVLAAGGAIYETIASSGDVSAHMPGGRLVDVGDYRMHIDCRGEGSPTVVMDAGLGGASLDWTLVQPQVAATTRACTYDRAGMGWSETGPLPRTPRHIADELHTLLRNADITGPYILVGHSLAGKNIRMFAAAHPEQVAGMVLVDARSERVDQLTPKADADAFGVALGLQGTLFSVARRLGVARAFGAQLADAPLLSPAAAAEMALLQTEAAAIDETVQEGLARSADDAELSGFALGAMPLVVIAARASLDGIPNWSTAQQQMAALSTNGRLVVAEHSGHAVPLERPDIVIEGISQILADVRAER